MRKPYVGLEIYADAAEGVRLGFFGFEDFFMDKEQERPLVLVIAGVDSGGGAGVTADVISVHDQGAWALPVVTALTCQSLNRVTLVAPTSVEVFKESIALAVHDWSEKISAIKIGLITDNNLLNCLLDLLKGPLKGIPVVWDPVLTATAGTFKSADIKGKLAEVLKHTTVFTPNLPEALALAGWDESELFERGGVFSLCDVFIKQGAKAVLLKGGHNVSALDAVDVFKCEQHAFVMEHAKKEGLGAHGGGCALSSSFAALLACGYAPQDAAVLAKVYVTRGIFETEVEHNHKRPPISHHALSYDLKYMPRIIEEHFPQAAGPFLKCPFNLGLYPVVDNTEILERLLALGVKTIQLRIKTPVHDDESDAHLCAEIKRACFLGRSYRARVFIDDHYKLAAKYGAYGVHLGMEDLQDADLDFIVESGLRLGVSTHGIYEVCKAMSLQPSYIAIGHVFPTKTKQMPSQPQGIAKMGLQARMLKGVVPTVAIGGIKLQHAHQVLEEGIDSIAVVTAITEAENPSVETQKWIAVCRTGPSELFGKDAQAWHQRQDEQETPELSPLFTFNTKA